MNNNCHLPLALRWNRVVCDFLYYTKRPAAFATRALAMVHGRRLDGFQRQLRQHHSLLLKADSRTLN